MLPLCLDYFSKFFFYFYAKYWLFTYQYGVCNPVRIHGRRINGIYDMIYDRKYHPTKTRFTRVTDIHVYEKYSFWLMGRVGLVVLKLLWVVCFTQFSYMKPKISIQVFYSHLLIRVLFVPFSITVPFQSDNFIYIGKFHAKDFFRQQFLYWQMSQDILCNNNRSRLGYPSVILHGLFWTEVAIPMPQWYCVTFIYTKLSHSVEEWYSTAVSNIIDNNCRGFGFLLKKV